MRNLKRILGEQMTSNGNFASKKVVEIIRKFLFWSFLYLTLFK
jgi:hypothetical protein